MADKDSDERFKLDGDPEVALRELLQADPASLAALDATRRAAVRDVREAKQSYEILVENARRAGKVPARQVEVQLAAASLDTARAAWRRIFAETNRKVAGRE